MVERSRVHPPRLAGLGLDLVLSLSRSALGGAVRARLVRDSGVLALTRVRCDEPPAFLPPIPVAEERGGTEASLESIVARERPSGLDGYATIADYARTYRSGETSPLEVAERLVEATRSSEERDPPMRVFIARDADDILEQARESSARLREGRARSALEGVPIAVKDELDQVPHPTTVGTRVHGETSASGDATVVARLRAKGALLIGKTNMHEVGIGVTGLNPIHGTPRNPHDPLRHTGGSSSGSASAVALGFCPAAIGADGGGSIRIPAAFCGVVGLKPTFGRVSEFGAAPLCWSVAHIGPIALTVDDAAALYAVIAGRDELDPMTRAQPPVRVDDHADLALSGLRIGVADPWFDDAEPDVVETCRQALARLCDRGAEIVPVDVPDTELARLAHLVTIATEITASQEPHFAEHRSDYAPDTQLAFALAASLPPTLYVRAQRVRARVARGIAAALAGVDVLATPTTACLPPVVPRDALASGESNLGLFEAIMRFVTIPNLVGLPAISVPAGFVGKLPVGLQLIAPAWREHVLFRVARVVEAGTARRLPEVRYRLLG